MDSKVTEKEIREIKSMDDEAAKKLMKETPEGKSPYYYALGKMGSLALRDKYESTHVTSEK